MTLLSRIELLSQTASNHVVTAASPLAPETNFFSASEVALLQSIFQSATGSTETYDYSFKLVPAKDGSTRLYGPSVVSNGSEAVLEWGSKTYKIVTDNSNIVTNYTQGEFDRAMLDVGFEENDEPESFMIPFRLDSEGDAYKATRKTLNARKFQDLFVKGKLAPLLIEGGPVSGLSELAPATYEVTSTTTTKPNKNTGKVYTFLAVAGHGRFWCPDTLVGFAAPYSLNIGSDSSFVATSPSGATATGSISRSSKKLRDLTGSTYKVTDYGLTSITYDGKSKEVTTLTIEGDTYLANTRLDRWFQTVRPVCSVDQPVVLEDFTTRKSEKGVVVTCRPVPSAMSAVDSLFAGLSPVEPQQAPQEQLLPF